MISKSIILLISFYFLNANPLNGNDLNVELECKPNEESLCQLNTDHCPEGYSCQENHSLDLPGYGLCYRTANYCRTADQKCCDDTDCCRRFSDTNAAPLSCVDNICRVLVSLL